jgi:hypothetical protein
MIKLTTSATAAAFVVAASSLAFAATNHTGTARSGSSTAGINKTQAINEIQTDGYTNVQDLRKNKGGWTATAREGGKPVSLHIDSLGNVRKE